MVACATARSAACLATALLSASPCGRAADILNATEASKEIENPVTRQITLPVRYEAQFNEGAGRSTKHIVELNQAVVPFRLNEEWALITRTKLPWVSQPPKTSGADRASGLGSGYTTFFLSPRWGEGFYWGTGPVLSYPAANSDLGTDKWGAGAALGFVKKDESPWVFGAIVNNIWSFDESSGSGGLNKFLLNPFIGYHFDGGWSISSSPSITANWLASGGKWTVPIGGGISKVIRLADQPVKLALASYYNAIRPDTRTHRWALQFTMTWRFHD